MGRKRGSSRTIRSCFELECKRRRRNRKLNALTQTIVSKMSPDHPEVSKEAWRIIFWRSPVLIIRGGRSVTLEIDRTVVT